MKKVIDYSRVPTIELLEQMLQDLESSHSKFTSDIMLNMYAEFIKAIKSEIAKRKSLDAK